MTVATPLCNYVCERMCVYIYVCVSVCLCVCVCACQEELTVKC